MNQENSIPALVADLERQIAHCRQVQAEHAEQERHHLAQAELYRDQGARAAAELQVLEERHRTFQTAAEQAGELAGRFAPPPSGPPKPRFSERQLQACHTSDGILVLGRLVSLWIQTRPEDEPVGAKRLTEELEAQFGAKLSRRLDPRTVGQQLRRLAARGEIGVARVGTPHYEALYRPKP